jgi:hypothetical protein
VHFVERRSDLKFELDGLIGSAATVGGWGGAEPQRQTRPWFCRQNAEGAEPRGESLLLRVF